jgi:hypothetical protein
MDWDFGLTRRAGSAKPALTRVADTWREWQRPSDALGDFPKPRMSIVVCTYRGVRLLRPCLESFRQLRYPEFEVIVVNDGGDSEVAEITAEYPEVKTRELRPQSGLSDGRDHCLHRR